MSAHFLPLLQFVDWGFFSVVAKLLFTHWHLRAFDLCTSSPSRISGSSVQSGEYKPVHSRLMGILLLDLLGPAQPSDNGILVMVFS